MAGGVGKARGRVKTLHVSERVWRAIMRVRVERGFRTVNETVEWILERAGIPLGEGEGK
jgi:hypothetical protein